MSLQSSPILWTILPGVVTVVALIWRWTRPSDRIPVINSHPGDYTLKKAHDEYLKSSKELVARGVAKFDGPFRIITTLGSRVILPARFAGWVKNCKDLDHVQFVTDEYFALYPGFEANGVVVDPSRMMINLAKTKLAQNSQCQLFEQHLSELLQEEWTDESEWRTVEWSQNVARYVGRMSSAVFAGPELARDPEWQKLILAYTVNLFNGVRALRTWPGFLRPFVHWFLPECINCRDQLKHAHVLLKPTLEKRERAKKEALAADRVPEQYQDVIAWMEEIAAGRPFDPAAAQLAFAISAMHTTSELMKQVLVDICLHPELIQPLREEAAAAIEESGWTTAGVFKMQLMDSVIKETQRLKPGTLVNLERKVMVDIVLPDGTRLPKGTNIAVDTSDMWNPEIYADPEVYDGYRFYNIRQKGGPGANMAQLASASTDHIAFGLGKPICPGRFMVANEIKVAMATILMKYDVRLPQGSDPKVVHYGFEMLADPTTKLEVRRRRA
jgi:hypothetical protein